MKLDFMAPWRWAQQELKEMEIGGAHFIRRVVWYHSFTSLKGLSDSIPWCSSFLCAAAEQSGFKSTGDAAAKSWLTYGIEGTGEVGDIVVLCYGGNFHVTLLNKPFRAGDAVLECIGGNQANKVSIVNFKASGLVCFRRFPVT